MRHRRRRSRKQLEQINADYRRFIADDLRTIDTLKRFLHKCEAERNRLREQLDDREATHDRTNL